MFSTWALAGLAAGFLFAVVDYLILLPLIERPMRAGLARLVPPERERAEGRLRVIRLIFAWQFLVFPIVGYVLGRVIDAGAAP